MVYDFIILFGVRSGSHMLGDALNSHPQIACKGEREADVVVDKEPTDKTVNGRLLQYATYDNKINKGKKGFPSTRRIILLVRDPKQRALSHMMNHEDNTKNRNNHLAHFYGGEKPQHFKLDPKQHLRLTRKFRKADKSWINTLKKSKYPYLIVNYEDLTGGKEIDEIPREKAQKILNFLGLPYRPLKTKLKKSPRTFEMV
jgi:hypothetical protein